MRSEAQIKRVALTLDLSRRQTSILWLIHRKIEDQKHLLKLAFEVSNLTEQQQLELLDPQNSCGFDTAHSLHFGTFPIQ